MDFQSEGHWTPILIEIRSVWCILGSQWEIEGQNVEFWGTRENPDVDNHFGHIKLTGHESVLTWRMSYIDAIWHLLCWCALNSTKTNKSSQENISVLQTKWVKNCWRRGRTKWRWWQWRWWGGRRGRGWQQRQWWWWGGSQWWWISRGRRYADWGAILFFFFWMIEGAYCF